MSVPNLANLENLYHIDPDWSTNNNNISNINRNANRLAGMSNDAPLTTSVPGSAIGALNPGRLMPVSLVEQDGRIAVSSPYHPRFPARARSLGGIWDAAQRVWLFDAADHERVRSLCREIYGTDGPEDGRDTAAPFPSAVAHGRNEFAEGTPPVPHYYG